MSLENDRFVEADAAFRLAFHAGHANERQLAETKALPPLETPETARIIIPRPDIRDGEWGQHVHQFEAAGRRAAHWGAAKVTLEPADQSESATFDGELTWRVMAEPV